MPINKDAVELRLHPARWPEVLDRQGLGGENTCHNAIEEARKRFNHFESVLADCKADRNLSAAGRRAKLKAYLDQHGPGLLKHLPSIEERAKGVEDAKRTLMRDTQAPPPVEPADIALMQEIRGWLRSLPEIERASTVRRVAMAGDRSALRAVATAPDYLTQVDRPTFDALREHLFQQDHPERAAKMAAFPQAANLASLAIQGVVEYIGEVITHQVDLPPQATSVGYLPAHPPRI